MSVLQLPRAIFEGLRAHGEETYPHECCGALLGRPICGGARDGWRISAMVRAANARGDGPAGGAKERYEIAPAELVKIAREARSQSLEIVGFYHSHPDHAAQWSAVDLAEAHWLGCSYLITEIARGKAAATNAFLLAGSAEEDKRFEDQIIEIDDSGPAAV